MLVEDFLRVHYAGFVLPEVTDRVPFENAAEGQTEFDRELVWRFLEVQGVLYLSPVPSALREATVERLPACQPWHSMQGEDGSPYLQVYVIADAFPIALYGQWLFDELERSELRVIICDNDFACGREDQIAMVPAHTDVSYPHLGQLCASDFDDRLGVEVDHVDSLRSRLCHRLDDHVVLNAFVDDVVEKVQLAAIARDEDVRERVFTDLAFQTLPDVRVDDRCFLAVPLAVKPFSQAAEPDPSQGARALARRYQLMVRELLLREADPTDLALMTAHSLLFLLFPFIDQVIIVVHAQVRLLHVK